MSKRKLDNGSGSGSDLHPFFKSKYGDEKKAKVDSSSSSEELNSSVRIDLTLDDDEEKRYQKEEDEDASKKSVKKISLKFKNLG